MPPQPTPARPAHRARVLALTVDLGSDLATVDLDEIDGEFYWRCARADLLAQIEALRAKLPPVPERGHAPAHNRPFADLRAEQERAKNALGLGLSASSLYPSAVWNRLERGERVPMRAPEVNRWMGDFLNGTNGREPDTLRVKVFSGAWTGADVEREIESLVDQRPPMTAVPLSVTTSLSATTISVWLDFDFVDDPAAAERYWEVGRNLRLPFVLVVVGFPLPPSGVVGREYDAIVRDLKRWHLALPGAASRQDKEVAVRTWAVGLLMAAGERFIAAMREVCKQGGLPEVSQTRFGQDRQRLVERVPEAAAHLYAREEQPRALAKGDAPPAPLQASSRPDPV